ncbi:uncharacterized protein LOC135467858 [Liolophura sinensis]|uniref:uncharacterized protein LOC135467858 n=1 Tax=Liolophura sinensis TaxID=3198878 RepID=UPI0031590DBF
MANHYGNINQKFAEQLFKYGRQRIPQYSKQHPVIPHLYVPEWKTDMRNRNLIIKNASSGGVPHYEHDENLFLEKREQMMYNVENRNRVESKGRFQERLKLLQSNIQGASESKVEKHTTCLEEHAA